MPSLSQPNTRQCFHRTVWHQSNISTFRSEWVATVTDYIEQTHWAVTICNVQAITNSTKITYKHVAMYEHVPDAHYDVIKNVFRIVGPLWRETTRHRWFPSQRPATRSFDVFLDLCLNKRLSKESIHQWFATPSRSLWRHCNAIGTIL